IMLGAALAASLAGKFAPKAKLPLGSLLAAAIGGVLMGYGARLSFGCNIGALFSGIASGSLHGWVWFAAAFVGTILGIYARPLFGLDGFAKKLAARATPCFSAQPSPRRPRQSPSTTIRARHLSRGQRPPPRHPPLPVRRLRPARPAPRRLRPHRRQPLLPSPRPARQARPAPRRHRS